MADDGNGKACILGVIGREFQKRNFKSTKGYYLGILDAEGSWLTEGHKERGFGRELGIKKRQCHSHKKASFNDLEQQRQDNEHSEIGT